MGRRGLCCPLRERNAVICLAERDERCSFSELLKLQYKLAAIGFSL